MTRREKWLHTRMANLLLDVGCIVDARRDLQKQRLKLIRQARMLERARQVVNFIHYDARDPWAPWIPPRGEE